ncbi:hypothetical protein K523DRAFT_418171 [Schizophyllum commune Tattone D]|nr:hypothetical protein K525DRAFT_274981 [Schizophyllum commune Loenen D]KAI5827770.1 hypothetical protein K523DRAFT_418171 [Schizophyllum commune Tattone D]
MPAQVRHKKHKSLLKSLFLSKKYHRLASPASVPSIRETAEQALEELDAALSGISVHALRPRARSTFVNVFRHYVLPKLSSQLSLSGATILGFHTSYHCAHMSVPAAFASTPTPTSPAIALPSDDNDNETDTDANSVLAAVVMLLVDLAVRATIRVVHASGMHRAACISHCGLSWLREHFGRGGSWLAAGKVDNGERSM